VADESAVDGVDDRGVDAAWLTGVLRRAGALSRGEVTSVALRASDAFNSSTVFVAATYQNADPGLPTRLVVKRPSAAPWSRAAAAEEARFYRHIATLPDHPPVVPPCLAADDTYLVLADLSVTHVEPVSRAETIANGGMPTPAALEAAVDALADLHRYWWRRDWTTGGPAVPFEIATWWGDQSSFDSYAGRRRRSWEAVRGEVPDGTREVYERVFDGLDRHYRRTLRPRLDGPLTLLHGDAYLSNFVVPIAGDGGAYLLDWQSPSIDIGALDLANMCATFWTREQRHSYEERVLRRYHARLAQPDYPYGALLADYRLGVADWLLVPVQDAADGSDRGYWWPKMSRLVDAFTDHQCGEFFA
jgi:Ecdysteroid kinase-like family